MEGEATKNSKKGKKGWIIAVIVIAIMCFFGFLIEKFDPEYANRIANQTDNKPQYMELNPQELFNDYDDNEISAKKKYTGNYYYFTGTIHDITHYLTDDYLVIRFSSDRNAYRVIDLNAYFNNPDDLINLKKGDNVTIYGKFKQRTFENYMGIASFSFENCKLNNP